MLSQPINLLFCITYISSTSSHFLDFLYTSPLLDLQLAPVSKLQIAHSDKHHLRHWNQLYESFNCATKFPTLSPPFTHQSSCQFISACRQMRTIAIKCVKFTTARPISLVSAIKCSPCLPHAYLNKSFSSPLSPSITPSLFHSKLKTYLFGKSFTP